GGLGVDVVVDVVEGRHTVDEQLVAAGGAALVDLANVGRDDGGAGDVADSRAALGALDLHVVDVPGDDGDDDPRVVALEGDAVEGADVGDAGLAGGDEVLVAVAELDEVVAVEDAHGRVQ